MSHESDQQAEKPATKNLGALDVQAYEQRQSLLSLIDLAREHLRPANLRQEATNKILDFGLDTIDKAKSGIRRNPGKAALAAIATGAFVARKPLLRLCKQGYAALCNKSAPARLTDASSDTPKITSAEKGD